MQESTSESVRSLLARASALLDQDAQSESGLLLGHVLERSKAWLIAHADDAVNAEAGTRFESLIARRIHGEPVAQLLGRKSFWSFDLRITPDVLIPRAETELLVEQALAVLPVDVPSRVADLGTGSGAVALAIASERPLVEVVAVDASEPALAVARSNAKDLGLASRVQCLLGDWYVPLGNMRFDAIVSNPPYIAEGDRHLGEGDLRFEPVIALASGADGLDAIRNIVQCAPDHLLPGGWLLIEHGWNQGSAVRALFAETGFVEVVTCLDLESRERTTLGRRGDRPQL